MFLILNQISKNTINVYDLEPKFKDTVYVKTALKAAQALKAAWALKAAQALLIQTPLQAYTTAQDCVHTRTR